MLHVFRGLLVVAIAVLGAGLITAQDEMVPFTDEQFGIQGAIPEGWTARGMGLYARSSSLTDPTLLALQAAPGTPAQVLTSILPQLGLEEAPESVGTLDTPIATWTLYQVDVPAGGITIRVDLALAQVEDVAYLALLQTDEDEYEALHDSVFLPVVESIAPLAATATEEPVPYVQEAVTFSSGDVTLAGTLTLPEGDGPFPVVILVTGSGPQDRDETIVLNGMRPFYLIADALTRAGVAVLRYDDRGVGESTGDFDSATIDDFASDARAAVAYLQSRDDINSDQIGLLGHSEGGIVAADVATGEDTDLAFVISLAGTALPGREILRAQSERVLIAEGSPQEVIDLQLGYIDEIMPLIEAGDFETIETLTRDVIHQQMEVLPQEERAVFGDPELYVEQATQGAMQNISSASYRSFLESDPAPDWQRTTIPTLVILGGRDVQVPADLNTPAFEAALTEAGNPDFEIVTLPDANHLFQAAETGALSEYAALPKTFTPDLLPLLVEWVTARVDEAA